MKNKSLIIILLILCLASLVKAQNLQGNEVFVSSWKKGGERITEQTLQVNLTPENSRFEKDILSRSGKIYRLIIIPNYNKSLRGEHWKVELREVNFDESTNEEKLGDDLFFVERPGEVGDNFPREDFVAYFYPNEEKKILINGVPWIEGTTPLYPVKTMRKIQVESFLATLKTGEIKFNEKNKNKTDSFEIFIEFTNTCKKN